nr:hypothetical protein [Methanoregula sp.]
MIIHFGNASRTTDSKRIPGEVMHNHASCPDDTIITDNNAFQDYGVHTDPAVFTNDHFAIQLISGIIPSLIGGHGLWKSLSIMMTFGAIMVPDPMVIALPRDVIEVPFSPTSSPISIFEPVENVLSLTGNARAEAVDLRESLTADTFRPRMTSLPG